MITAFVFIHSAHDELELGRLSEVGRLEFDHRRGSGKAQIVTNHVDNRGSKLVPNWHQTDIEISRQWWESFVEKLTLVWSENRMPDFTCEVICDAVWSSTVYVVERDGQPWLHLSIENDRHVMGPDAQCIEEIRRELDGLLAMVKPPPEWMVKAALKQITSQPAKPGYARSDSPAKGADAETPPGECR